MSNFITTDFEPTSSKAWKQKIQVDLKGADYNEVLLTATNEGISIKPFYHSDQFEKLAVPRFTEDFKICQKFNVTSEVKANSDALDAVNKGATSIKFAVNSTFDSEKLFKNLLEKSLEFHFQFKSLNFEFLKSLISLLTDENVSFNIDCLGKLTQTGNWFNSMENDFKQIANLTAGTSQRILGIDMAIYQNAGANCVQQLAYGLAHLNEYLNRGLLNTDTPIQLNIAIGSHYFFEISKIRALRYLANKLLKEYGHTGTLRIYAEPSLRNKTLYDYNVNMLRTTTESMSAVLGGSNTISNCSYDVLFHAPNDFGERIARNQLLILKEECSFIGAHDFATNSYYIESITKQIAEKALLVFKDVESGGGLIQQLFSGAIQRKIKENAAKEQTQFDTAELVLLGTNKYPNELDKMKGELQIEPFLAKKPIKTLIEPVIPKRLAANFERKRLENEA